MAFYGGVFLFSRKKEPKKAFHTAGESSPANFFLHRAGFAPSARDVTGCDGWVPEPSQSTPDGVASSPDRGSLWQGREVYCLQVSFFMPLTCKHRTCPLCQGLALRESCRRRRLRGFARQGVPPKRKPANFPPLPNPCAALPIGAGAKSEKRLCQRHTARFCPGDLRFGVTRGEQPLVRCGERGVQRVRGGSRNTPLTLWPSGASCL